MHKNCNATKVQRCKQQYHLNAQVVLLSQYRQLSGTLVMLVLSRRREQQMMQIHTNTHSFFDLVIIQLGGTDPVAFINAMVLLPL
jgi:hypothetical protein